MNSPFISAERVLPDTSIWVDYLRAAPDSDASMLDSLISEQQVVVCGPVVAELVSGTAVGDQEALIASLSGLPWAEIDRGAWTEVGIASSALRKAGMKVPLTDIEIAVAAVRSGSTLWTRDADFDRVSKVLPSLKIHGTH